MTERAPTASEVTHPRAQVTGIHQVLAVLAPSSRVPPWVQAAAVIAFATTTPLASIVAVQLEEVSFRRGEALLAAAGREPAIIPPAFAGPLSAIVRVAPPMVVPGEQKQRRYLFPSSTAADGHLSVSALTHRFRASGIVLIGHRNLQVRAALQAAAQSIPLASLGAGNAANADQIWQRYPR